MIRRLLFGVHLLFCCLVWTSAYGQDSAKEQKRRSKVMRKAAMLPDSVFGSVKMEDLLNDEVYVKLARDGWSSQEIVAIMNTVMKNKKKAKEKFGYGKYAKQWLPAYGYTPGGDSLYQFIDTTYNEAMQASVASLVPDDVLNYTWPKIVYTPEDRKKGIRNPGYFRSLDHKPFGGRVIWATVHPEDHNKLYVIPDGGGISKTDDGGRTWVNITDNIPVRAHRHNVSHSAIPVDPDDWNHLFAFTSSGPVYETCDGGLTWRLIVGATHKSFKRGYAFRDKAGNLKFIGAQRDGGLGFWRCKLWISEDTCKTWTQVVVPTEMQDAHPESDGRGVWFQAVEFDPSNRDMIYIPGSRSIFYFDDGAKSTIVNGVKTYNIKKMSFDVYDNTRTNLRNDPSEPDNKTIFPLRATGPGNMAINPHNPNQMWFAAGIRSTNQTALYYTEDKGKTWVTLHEPSAGIGSGALYGNETAFSWLGGFGVNFRDPNWVYGCSQNSAWSSNGGVNFSQYTWGARMKSLQDDGNYYYVSNARHNADNHFILSHKSGRVFRGSDAGLLMKDLDVFNNGWNNISGNMSAMLYYAIRVNEFGDQVIAGNTQDIDVQTYRYGRWGHWRGYEGSEICINPYTTTCYFSGSGGGGINVGLSSWFTTLTWADVHTGFYYMQRKNAGGATTFYRLGEDGYDAVDLTENIGSGAVSLAFARDKGHTTIFVRTPDNFIKRSVDGGNTFENILYNGQPAKFSNSVLAADPDNSDILYLGQTGKVTKWYVNESRIEPLNEGLPNVGCTKLFFHEGSGDLYFVHGGSSGIYILEKGSDTWRLWLKGYNKGSFGDAIINYTTQEMVISDYGRGAWVADLEHPSDRFFKNGFGLKEISHRNGRRTIGIDTEWTIPLYYYYEWTVNGEKVDNPYQYLTRDLQPGDKVQLKLTLRESPDVSTLSAEYTVRESENMTLVHTPGNALLSSGSGKVDLGYVDYFFNDFTIDMWVKPLSNGVLLSNRAKAIDKGAKGWVLFVENGTLCFRYSPSCIFNKPTYEPASDEQKTVSGGTLNMGQWNHVAVTEKRDGSICLYVNGVLKGSGERYRREHTLNDAAYLSLFADVFDAEAIQAAVDELKIWNYELSQDEIRREMYSSNADNRDGLVAYFDFNGENLAADRETFAGYQPRAMMKTKVAHEKMPLSICADRAVYGVFEDGEKLYTDNGVNLMRMKTRNTAADYQVGLYAYSTQRWNIENSNLGGRYFDVEPCGYIFRNFVKSQNDSLTVDFYATDGRTFNPHKRYRLYVSEDGTSSYWTQLGDLTYQEDTQTLRMDNVPVSDLEGKKLVVASVNPSIEMTIEGMSKSGDLYVYTEDRSTFKAHATLVSGLPEPNSGVYDIVSDNDMLQPQSGFYFTKGEASLDLKVGQNLGAFNERCQVVLRGKDDEMMIPTPVNVVNRITPKELGNSVKLEQGGIAVGFAENYKALNASNTMTLMGWVRLDDSTMLTGTKPLFLFRSASPSVASGLNLEGGNVRCHWNEESWSWSTKTGHNVTADQLGRWIHFALVARPDGMDYYMNGVKYTVKRNISKGRVYSMLMLGQNKVGDAWFSGAFDQVSVWNRSLTEDEVLKYMRERVLVDAPGLVAYVTMDVKDDKGQLRECVQDMPLICYGNVIPNYRSIVPFNPESSLKLSEMSDTTEVQLVYPAGKSVQGQWSAFNSTSYNYVSQARQADLPLSKSCYSLVYTAKPQLVATDTVALRYRHVAILENDSLVMAIRPLGSEEPFESFVGARATANGTVEFRVEGTQLNSAAEVMFFIAAAAGKRPVKMRMGLNSATDEIGNIMLDNTMEIPFQVKVVSGSADDVVMLNVKETAYASLDKNTVDMNGGDNSFVVRVDSSKLDKMGLNPITVQTVGAESEPLKFNVYLEPRVEIRLKNGTDAHNIVATTPTPDLEVEVELVQGFLSDEVELETVTDLNSAMNIGNGSLLSNNDATIERLEHYESPYGETQEGWNLIGNPYLAGINITKHQNVSFDDEKVTKFIYQYNDEHDNYMIYDMTNFDEEQRIMPFHSYFVQTMEPNAELTVTPVAKEMTINRRTFDCYTAEERTSVRLMLYTGDKANDRTEVVWEDGASPEFIVNEDAPKLWSMGATANQLLSVAGKTAVSVNTLPTNVTEVPLGLRVGTKGKMSIRMDKVTGFTNKDHIVLCDTQTGAEWDLDDEEGYEFEVANTGDVKGRFMLKVKRGDATGIGDEEETHHYEVYVADNTCTIENLRGRAEIHIFNSSGQLLVRDKTDKRSYTVSLSPGVHIVKIKENGKDYVTKIIVK